MLCPPLWGRDHNIQHLWERAAGDQAAILGGQKKHFLVDYLAPVRSDEAILPAADTLKELVAEGTTPVFFVNVSETMADPDITRLLDLCQRAYYIAPNDILFIIVMDMRWNEDEFFDLAAQFRSLCQNVIRPTVYRERETMHLLHYWLARWDYQLPRQTLQAMASMAGGILLLAKAAVRVAVKERLHTLDDILQTVPTHPDFTVQIRFFLSRLTPHQRQILTTIAKGKTPRDQLEVRHLEAMGFLAANSNGWEVTSRFLRDYLTDPTRSPRKLRAAVQRSKQLSEREKRMAITLLDDRGKSVSRDAFAKILWGKEYLEKFSDWALDQAVSRLRRKLDRDPLLKTIRITTQKKHGFTLS